MQLDEIIGNLSNILEVKSISAIDEEQKSKLEPI